MAVGLPDLANKNPQLNLNFQINNEYFFSLSLSQIFHPMFYLTTVVGERIQEFRVLQSKVMLQNLVEITELHTAFQDLLVHLSIHLAPKTFLKLCVKYCARW